MSKPDLTALILTYNEEIHIERCLQSVCPVCKRIVVVDSFSTDNTKKIVTKYSCDFYEHSWNNKYADQLNWGLDNTSLTTEWVLRIDADEYLTAELIDEINEKLPTIEKTINGIEFNRRNYFKGKWIRFGGYYPTIMLRIWRTGIGRCETRLMDEHIVIKEGTIIRFKNDFIDDNLQSVFWWTNKHNKYAIREAVDLLNIKYKFIPDESSGNGTTKQAKVKRLMKEMFYSRLPLGIRPLLYFVYRFFFRLGFLDGPRGWAFHFLQGFWYRFLVDINVWEAEQQIKHKGIMAADVVKNEWSINI
jgi:glycosyltransferase involved in cell wall biosynthesis